jgi:hypothetical protein
VKAVHQAALVAAVNSRRTCAGFDSRVSPPAISRLLIAIQYCSATRSSLRLDVELTRVNSSYVVESVFMIVSEKTLAAFDQLAKRNS